MSCKSYPTFGQCLACRRHSRNLGVRGLYELPPRALPIAPPPIQQDSGSNTTVAQLQASPRALGIDDVGLKMARVAEERIIQRTSQIPTFPKHPSSVNLVDSTSAVDLHAEEDLQACLLKDFMAKINGA
ncbi:hypothetical protein PGT21_000209 [Puccinia graminis f. sp. tritici]|uniref:Uncharacterized protein n=1 Tax=Puccinia graminis f. sp. tritici TaxID=56615 RepID=A0A5B0PP79_PUCGR|nr:hypothetical protein PGT21_000209 [Puccinia graminis f. sp. tritici]